MSSKHIAVYVRVSSQKQDTASQLPDLRRWVEAYAADQEVVWYTDKASGKTMERKAWRRVEKAINLGRVSKVVVWRLDRLGRTASGLTTLFDELRQRKVGLVSIRDGVDLETPAGRLMANVLASVAAYENEVRAERILAGQAAAKAAGKTWGGSQKGRRISVRGEQVEMVRRLHADKTPIAAIARTVGLSRPTVYRLLNEPKAVKAGQ
jgi:DNA invertase Pin-like site-specific DNA recombinase